MVTITELKINRYKATTIPSPKELFSRFGFSNKKGSYTGENKAPLNESKIEKVAEVQKIAIKPEEE